MVTTEIVREGAMIYFALRDEETGATLTLRCSKATADTAGALFSSAARSEDEPNFNPGLCIEWEASK